MVTHNGKWLDANSYIDFQMVGLIVDDNISLKTLRENMVNKLSLDLLAIWHLFVNIEHSSNSCHVMELRSNKDVHWYLNLVRAGKSVSFGLIISDCYLGESTSRGLVIGDASDGSHMASKSLPCISIMQDVNLSNLPTDFDIHVNQIFGSKFDVQKAVTLLAIKNNF